MIREDNHIVRDILEGQKFLRLLDIRILAGVLILGVDFLDHDKGNSANGSKNNEHNKGD